MKEKCIKCNKQATYSDNLCSEHHWNNQLKETIKEYNKKHNI